MGDASQSPFVGHAEMVTAALVARRYDFDNRSKVQIAGVLGRGAERDGGRLERCAPGRGGAGAQLLGSAVGWVLGE